MPCEHSNVESFYPTKGIVGWRLYLIRHHCHDCGHDWAIWTKAEAETAK